MPYQFPYGDHNDYNVVPDSVVNDLDYKGIGNQQKPIANPITHTTDPIVTGTSVLAVKYKDGVAMIADTLASYGSLARFRTEQRMEALGNNVLIGATGDLSDFQWVMRHLEEQRTASDIQDDGHSLSPKSVHSFLTRLMYNRRNKMEPLWDYFVVAGFWNGQSHLGVSDLRGGSFDDDTIATGYGNFIARPLMRKGWRADLSLEEARSLLEGCMRVLYYRDARSYNRLQFATVTANGVTISKPYELTTDWSSGVIKYEPGVKEF